MAGMGLGRASEHHQTHSAVLHLSGSLSYILESVATDSTRRPVPEGTTDEQPEGEDTPGFFAIPVGWHRSKRRGAASVPPDEEGVNATVVAPGPSTSLVARASRSLGRPQRRPERRAQLRHRVPGIRAEVTTPTGARFQFTAVNVSSNGVLVSGRAGGALVPGVGMTCQIQLSGFGQMVSFDAHLVRAEGYSSGGSEPNLAFQFALLTQEQHGQLVQLIRRASQMPPPQRPSPWLVPVSGALVLFGVIAGGAYFLANRPSPLPVAVMTATRADVVHAASSRSPGEILAAQRETIRSNIRSAKVIKLHVKPGDRVVMGDLLARFDEALLSEGVKAAQNRLTTAQAQRRRALAQMGAPGDPSAGEALRRAEAAVANAASELDQKRGEMTVGEILAPFDGVVAELNAQSGDMLRPAAPICELVDDSGFRAHIPLDEADAGRVQLGMPARISVAGSDQPLEGIVESVGRLVRSDKAGKFVYVDLALPKGAPVKVGTSATADLILGRKENTLMVPEAAVLGEGSKRTVYVVDSSNQIEAREVTVGFTTKDNVEITSGLEDGAIVVSNAGTTGLRAGIVVDPKR